MRMSGSWRVTRMSKRTSILSTRSGCGTSLTHPGEVVRECLRLRFDQGTEPRVGEVLCRHKCPCSEELFGVLAGGDAYGRDTGGDRRGDPRDRVLEGEGHFGRDANFLQCGSVGGWIRLYGFHFVGEHDDIEEVSQLQGEQYRLDVLLRGVGDEGDPHPSLPASLYKVHETWQGFQLGGAFAKARFLRVTDRSSLLVGEVGEQFAHDLGRVPSADPVAIELLIYLDAVGLERIHPRWQVQGVGLRDRTVEVEEQGPVQTANRRRGPC